MSDFCVAKPLSNSKIFSLAKYYRKVLGVDDQFYIDVIQLLENKLYLLDKQCNVIIVPKKEMRNKHGYTIPENNEIYIREDVYEGALAGNGRDRFTIIHEIFHYLFHKGDNIERNIGFARMESKIPRYRDPEWQADAFAGAFLMDNEKIKNLPIREIMERCGVSYSAAKTQKSKLS